MKSTYISTSMTTPTYLYHLPSAVRPNTTTRHSSANESTCADEMQPHALHCRSLGSSLERLELAGKELVFDFTTFGVFLAEKASTTTCVTRRDALLTPRDRGISVGERSADDMVAKKKSANPSIWRKGAAFV